MIDVDRFTVNQGTISDCVCDLTKLGLADEYKLEIISGSSIPGTTYCTTTILSRARL